MKVEQCLNDVEFDVLMRLGDMQECNNGEKVNNEKMLTDKIIAKCPCELSWVGMDNT